MSITMFNKRGDDNLSRIITDNDTTYDNLYDYIEQLFIQNKENINNIRVTVENNSILDSEYIWEGETIVFAREKQKYLCDTKFVRKSKIVDSSYFIKHLYYHFLFIE